MSIGELPSWAVARTLDRLNVRVVRCRLAQDPARQGARALPPSPPPSGFHCMGAERRGGVSAERWGAAAGDWVATRLLPDGGESRSSGALVLLHGWLATPLHVDYLAWCMRPLLARGIEVWLPRLPAHIERTPVGAVSGSRCLVPDPAASASSVRTASAETNALGRWLRQRHPRVALWGISLGGWVAGVAVSRSADWDGLVLWSPVVDPVETMRASPLATAAGAGQDAQRLEPDADSLRDVIPLQLVPASSELEVLVVSGRYDDVALSQSVIELGRRWHAMLRITSHGHISMMLSREAWRHARRFVAEVVLR